MQCQNRKKQNETIILIFLNKINIIKYKMDSKIELILIESEKEVKMVEAKMDLHIL